MIGLLRSGLLAAAFAALAGPVQAGQLCGWLVETIEGDDLHQFSLWLQAEDETDVVYAMRGGGIVTAASQSYSPSRGSYALPARLPVKVWGIGTTLKAPAGIDIVAELRSPPKNADERTPLLARFSFQRRAPADGGAPPKPFGARRCVTVAAR
jgi:hypothetical protein